MTLGTRGVLSEECVAFYVTDSQSWERVHASFSRGIRIGSVTDGLVRSFIPDTGNPQSNSSGAVR